MATSGLSTFRGSLTIGLLWVAVFVEPLAASDRALSLSWDHESLTIRGDHSPGKGRARGLVSRGLLPSRLVNEGLARDGHSPHNHLGRSRS